MTGISSIAKMTLRLRLRLHQEEVVGEEAKEGRALAQVVASPAVGQQQQQQQQQQRHLSRPLMHCLWTHSAAAENSPQQYHNV
jgi:hypothetical protein